MRTNDYEPSRVELKFIISTISRSLSFHRNEQSENRIGLRAHRIAGYLTSLECFRF